MKKTNGQEGITLIALVVTIVVLLILAGVTIVYVMSDGGIFGTAQQAAEDTKVGAILDYVGNAQSQVMMGYYTPLTVGEGATAIVVNQDDGDASAAVKVLNANFPTGLYEAAEKTGTTGAGYAKGKFAGTYTITNKKATSETYTLTFDASGVPTCTKDVKADA